MKNHLVPIIALLTAGTAHGQILNIPVPNSDFSADGVVIVDDNPTAVTGYTFSNTSGSVDAYGVLTNSLTGTNVGDPNIPGNTSAGFINALGTNTSSFITDTLGTTIKPMTTYTFSIDIGNPTGTGTFDNPGDVTFGLLANGAPTGAFTSVPHGTIGESSNPNSANYETFTFSFTTNASGGFIGDDLEAQVIVKAPSYESQTYFDNLQVTAEAIPEPSTDALILGGLALLLGIRRLCKTSA